MSRIRVVISDVLRRVLCPPLWTCAEGTVWAVSVLVWEWGAAHRNMYGHVSGMPEVSTGPGKDGKASHHSPSPGPDLCVDTEHFLPLPTSRQRGIPLPRPLSPENGGRLHLATGSWAPAPLSVYGGRWDCPLPRSNSELWSLSCRPSPCLAL